MNRTPAPPIRLRTPLGRLRLAARVEGTTLLVLIGLAVPFKYWAGWPQGVAIMGPLHGAAFVAYWLALAEATAAGGWRPGEVLRTAVLSVIPFGPFFNERLLAAKVRATRTETIA